MTSALGESIWSQLAAATQTRTAFTLVQVGTAGPDGPQVRAMILRAVTAPHLFLATDRRTPKVAALLADPRIAITGWDPDQQVQLRLRGTAELVEDPTTLAQAWASFGPGTRALFTAPAPAGTPLSAAPRRDDAEPVEHFGWLRVRVTEIDHLDLAGPEQRRHLLRQEDDWDPVPIVP